MRPVGRFHPHGPRPHRGRRIAERRLCFRPQPRLVICAQGVCPPFGAWIRPASPPIFERACACGVSSAPTPQACRRASQPDQGASQGIAAPSAQPRAAHLQAPPSPSGAETGPSGTRTLKNGLKRRTAPHAPHTSHSKAQYLASLNRNGKVVFSKTPNIPMAKSYPWRARAAAQHPQRFTRPGPPPVKSCPAHVRNGNAPCAQSTEIHTS